MIIKVYYEDKNCPTMLEVPDEDCAIWVESDYRQRLEAAHDKSSVRRRTPQQIMDEECNKPTFNNEQRETRRHVSLNALDKDDNCIPGGKDVTQESNEIRYADLYAAIQKLPAHKQKLLREVFWEDKKQIEIAKAEGVRCSTLQNRLARIYAELRKKLWSAIM